MNWAQLCEDKNLRDLPYKIELNRQGQIVMSPTRNRHGYYQTEIALLLKTLLPHGYVITECAVETHEGAKVADAAWASPERWDIIKDEFSSSVAPEICVEVTSPSNTLMELTAKRDLYLKRGAREYWICDEQGRLTFFEAAGQLARSTMCPEFPNRVGE